jgi:ABC-type multidrug transport system ATPase subunit
MIRVAGLTKRYGPARAVDGVSFALAPGEALGLWGRNGAGKTTIIRCVLGLLRYEGTVEVAGFDVARDGKSARRAVGYVPQELALYGDLRIAEAVHWFGTLKRAARGRGAVVLEEVGLAAEGRKRVSELSGGMKQRLALAIALLADPPVLALDELTSNLDRDGQSSFLQMLAAQKQAGRTLLFASHRPEEVELIADRVLGLEAGQRAFECGAAELPEAARLRCLIKIHLDGADLDAAASVLRGRDFPVTCNGRSLCVEVGARAKAEPLEALRSAGVRVADFELLGDPLGGRSHG